MICTYLTDGQCHCPSCTPRPGAVITSEAPVKALDVQVGGGHYKDMTIQPIEFIMKNELTYCQANIIKYACRYKDKNGEEDLKKIKHYVDLLIDMEYRD